GIDENQVIIGHPQAAADQQKDAMDKDFLSLFLYRVEYGAYPADGGSEEPFFLRVHCMITAMGGTSSLSHPSPGEAELRITGAVLAELHRHPLLTLTVGEEPVAQLQVVPANLSLDDINHLWATQSSLPYRLSVAYELALLPVPLSGPGEKSPRVGAVSVIVQPDLVQPVLPDEGFGIAGEPPHAPHIQVDTRQPDWTPHICFLDEKGDAVYTLSMASGGSQKKVSLIALGALGTQVDLTWETWESVGSRMWKPAISGGQHPVMSQTLEPNAALKSISKEIDLPIKKPGQALLRATRSWQPQGKDPMVLTSNPLLVTVE
ncbi:MAG: DUF4255 domain-containing protein, partial [Nitrospirales bacterium]|nr:DUF4255 domain-containing protein [Nitrospirales bacterium]